MVVTVRELLSGSRGPSMGSWSWLHSVAGLSFDTVWATAAAPSVAAVAVSLTGSRAMAARTDCDRNALDDTPVWISLCIHSIVCGPVASQVVCTGGSIFSGAELGVRISMRLILSIIDTDHTAIHAIACGVDSVDRVWPVTTFTEICDFLRQSCHLVYHHNPVYRAGGLRI